MKKRFKLDNSLVGIFLKYIILYTLIIIITVFLFDYFSYKNNVQYFKKIDDIFKYQENLINDQYDEIPNNGLSNCDYVVFDENGELIFTTSNSILNYFTYSDCEVIIDYADKSSYKFFYLDSEDKAYLIALEKDNMMTDYVILDKNLKIIEGNLFSTKTYLSETELKIIQGNLFPNKILEKCTYLNSDNQFRTLVFISPVFDEEMYIEQIERQTYMEYALYFIIVFFMLMISYLLKRKLLKKIKPLNNAIESYKESKKIEIDKNNILNDYQNIIDNFETLIKIIEDEKKDKQRIIADISHDLKTPLTTILGYATALEQNIVSDQKKEYYIKSIINKANKANELLNTLIDYSKINHPQYILNLESKINFNEFIREYIISNYDRIQDKEFNLDIEIPEEKNEIYFDKQLLIRVLDNIIENSFKYNPKGTTLLVKIKRSEKGILLYLGDNGEGIDENIKNQIFEPFITSNDSIQKDR